MKKLLKTLIILVLVLIPISIVKAEQPDKVTMYVFYGSTCPHCQELEEYVHDTLRKDPKVKDFLEVKYYEVWEDSNNSKLMMQVGNKLNVEVKGVPFMIIGDEYYFGYGSSMDSKIVNTIVKQKNNDKYVDLVGDVITSTGISATESNPEPGEPIAPSTTTTTTKKIDTIGANESKDDDSKAAVTIAIVIVAVVIIAVVVVIALLLAIILIVVIAKKKNK